MASRGGLKLNEVSPAPLSRGFFIGEQMSKPSVVKVSPELLAMFNQAITREMQVSIQYFYQHVQWSGVKGFSVKSELRSIAISEMKHVEQIAERLYYLGGIPTTKPAPIFVGSTLQEMISQDIKDETNTIILYQSIIEKALSESDETTANLFRDLLEAEEGHHDTFVTLAEGI